MEGTKCLIINLFKAIFTLITVFLTLYGLFALVLGWIKRKLGIPMDILPKDCDIFDTAFDSSEEIIEL